MRAFGPKTLIYLPDYLTYLAALRVRGGAHLAQRLEVVRHHKLSSVVAATTPAYKTSFARQRRLHRQCWYPDSGIRETRSLLLLPRSKHDSGHFLVRSTQDPASSTERGTAKSMMKPERRGVKKENLSSQRKKKYGMSWPRILVSILLFGSSRYVDCTSPFPAVFGGAITDYVILAIRTWPCPSGR